MPTQVKFTGGQPDLTVAEEFEQVNGQLSQSESGMFTRLVGNQPGPRVTVYRASVAYIEELSEGGT